MIGHKSIRFTHFAVIVNNVDFSFFSGVDG